MKGGGAHMFSQSLEGLLILSLPTFFQVSSGCSVNCVSQRLHDLGHFYIAVPMSLVPLIPKSSAGSIIFLNNIVSSLDVIGISSSGIHKPSEHQ